MKTVIITVPMKPPHEVEAIQYPMDGNKTAEYEKPVRCPINGILAKTLKKDEQELQIDEFGCKESEETKRIII